MVKNFIKILELLGDRLEVCVSVYIHNLDYPKFIVSNQKEESVSIQRVNDKMYVVFVVVVSD